MSELEDLRIMERRASLAEKEDPWNAARWAAEAEQLRERLTMYDDLWADLTAQATDKVRATQLAALLQGYEGAQRIQRYMSALKVEGLITQAQFADAQRRLTAPTAREAKAIQEQAAENKALDQVMIAVLKAVGPENKREALAAYNQVGGPKSNEKMNEWVAKLVQLKLLPDRYRLSLRYGGIAISKMLDLFSLENK